MAAELILVERNLLPYSLEGTDFELRLFALSRINYPN